MSDIATSFIPSSAAALALRNKLDTGAAGATSFDALMSDARTRLDTKKLAESFIQNIMRALDKTLDALVSKGASQNVFPFSGEFQATFGSSGPLIDFIKVTTNRLGLSAEKNLALQTIAVRNKDTTNSPADIQKIGDELRAAGIM